MKRLSKSGLGLLLLCVALIAISVLASRLFWRLDLTEDRVFTLSDGTRSILKNLSHDTNVRLYVSRSVKSAPPFLKVYATRVEDILREYSAASRGRLTLDIIDPRPDTDEEEDARKFGLRSERMPTGETFYFGAVLFVGSREVVIPFFDPKQEDQLEYQLSETLVRSRTKEKAKVSILSPLPVLGGGMPMEGQAAEAWLVVQELRRLYDVQEMEVAAKKVPDGTRVLVVIHPKSISEGTQYAIDQFLVGGGRVFVAVDPFSRVDLARSGAMARMSGQMPQVSSDLPLLFSKWGVTYKPEEMVGDLKLATKINVGGVQQPYPFFVSLAREAFATSSIMTSRLNTMLFAEGGGFEIAAKPGLTFEPMIKTTKDSGTVNNAMASFMGPFELASQIRKGDQERTLAFSMTGKFSSAFASKPAEADATIQHLAAGTSEGILVAVADVDFIFDDNAVRKTNIFGRVLAEPLNDNLSFVLNAIEFLGGSSELISIRSRGRLARPFTRVQSITAEAQTEWKSEEERLNKRLGELQNELNQMQGQRVEDNKLILTPEQQAVLARAQSEERDVRRKLRDVRKRLREDIEKLGNRLIVANLLIVPFGVAGLGLIVMSRRTRRVRQGGKSS